MAKKTYRVIGDSPVGGVNKTDDDPTVKLELTDEQEAALIEGGHIKAEAKKKEG